MNGVLSLFCACCIIAGFDIICCCIFIIFCMSSGDILDIMSCAVFIISGFIIAGFIFFFFLSTCKSEHTVQSLA